MSRKPRVHFRKPFTMHLRGPEENIPNNQSLTPTGFLGVAEFFNDIRLTGAFNHSRKGH